MDKTSAVQPVRQLSGLEIFFFVFVPFALGHYLSSLLRNVNAVLVPNLMAAVSLTQPELGLLTSVFFFAFALVQLPVGMALDRYGPRRVQLLLMTLAAGGMLAFGMGHSFDQLLLARALMGAGLGGCFMSAVKALSMWVAAARLPSVHGYLIAVGGFGAASATVPVKLALRFTDWRGLFIDLAVATMLVGLLIYLVTPSRAGTRPRQQQAVPLRQVYREPAFRATVSLVLIPHTVFFGIQGLWIGKWLADVGRYSDTEVAYLLYAGMGAIILGAVLVGQVTEWAGRRGVRPLTVAACGIVLFVLVQAAMLLNLSGSFRLLAVLFTLAGTITGLEYAIVAQTVPAAMSGRAATGLNLLIFVGAFVVQAGFGLILACWPPDPQHHYPAIAYQVAFGVLIVLQLPGLYIFFRRRARRRAAPGLASGKMTLCGGHPAPLRYSEEDYETGSLRPARQGKTGTD
jgi:MFS family permease